ncbi:MAG: carboxypeptidase regulatory-like domain-containing protein [Terracidiphilus sp.]
MAVEEISGTSRGLMNGFLRCSRWGWLLLLVIAILTTVCANAQMTGKGTITGTVSDATGAVIPGAAVNATNEATGITAKTTTTSAGDYNFPNLDPGIYTVTVSASGFEKLTHKGIHVNAMESQTYNPVLTVGGSSIEITVTTALPQLETSNASLGSTMENEVYSELPIEMGSYGSPDQRRATDFVYLMPGVQGNETNGNATTNVGVVNGSGSRGAVSAVYVDGVVFVRAGGNGDPRYVWTAMSVDAIDQFQVMTTGYGAVYEGQGVMNYTVKQGGAKQHGSVYEFIRNTALDTWGFWGKAINPVLGVAIKPVEHSNEYGINLSGPLVPLGKWKEKVFYYGNYNGFRYTSATPTPMTFPTISGGTTGLGQAGGDFSAAGNQPIYDPSTQTSCTAHNAATTGGAANHFPCRYQYGYGAPTSGTGPGGAPVLGGVGSTGLGANIIPASQMSAFALNMQALLPTSGISSALQNNYIAPNATGLINWSTTDRIDFLPTSSDTITFIFADGRQASSNPVGQTTAGRNVGPVPFNYGQTYAPKTAVGIIEETHIFTPHLINQAKWGYARYNGPTFNPDQAPAYAATTMGLSNLPVGQAQQTFPITTFAGTNAQTNWGGTTANVTLAENYTALDNLQWTVGKHSFTFGGQMAWLLYNTYSATGGTTPLTLATAVTETAGIASTSTSSYTVASGTGMSYASFLLGQIDKGSLTDYSAHPGYGARFIPISPYVQDNWKVNSKLTLDLGLRYDFFPSVREVKDEASYFDPNLANPVTGINGALNYLGITPGTCNCNSPVKNYYRNFGPRIGLAYQLNPKTVIRSSWGVMFTHSDAVGGLTSTLGTLGFAASPSFSSTNDFTTMTGLTKLTTSAVVPSQYTGAVNSYTPPAGRDSGPQYGTGYTTNTISGSPTTYTAAPSGSNYDDPYLGGRAPEYINWSLGLQRQLTSALAATLTYVGSEGHFLQLDSYTARGVQSNQLDPKYLVLGSALSDTSTTVATDCSGVVTTDGFACNSAALSQFANATVKQSLGQFLKPYPFESPSDSFGYVGNSNYHSLQAMLNMRAWHGLTVNTNFAYSRVIDDGGTFRSGYAIPAGTIANHPALSYPVDKIERTVSTSNQKLHFVATTVWDWPLGKTVLNTNAYERAILGGFKFSGIYQQYTGSPLAITASACQTNPSLVQSSSSCAPTMNPNFVGQSARQNGRWGKGATTTNYTTISYIVPSVAGAIIGTPTSAPPSISYTGPFISPVANLPGVTVGTASGNQESVLGLAGGPAAPYTFGDAPRTAPYNLIGPGNYQLDLAMVRTFPLHITPATKLNFRAEWYNVTNHTLFGVASTVVGNASFGQVTSSATANRKAAQFSARIEF